jgi:hypothetical protein
MSSDEVINQIIRAIVQTSSHILKNESDQPGGTATETRNSTDPAITGSARESSQGANIDAIPLSAQSKMSAFVSMRIGY